jgi:hypothetical protein
LAINETAVPAVMVRRQRAWWLPLRALGLLTVGLPQVILAALLSAAMAGGDERD